MKRIRLGAAIAVGSMTAVSALATGIVLAPAAIAADEPAVENHLVINEVQSSAPDDQLGGQDWIELTNIGSQALDASGVLVSDADDDHVYVIPAGTIVEAGDYLLLVAYDDVDNPSGHFDYGLGKGDSVRLFLAGTPTFVNGDGDLELEPGAVPFEATTWTESQHTIASWARCADGMGDFRMTASATPGASNDCSGDIEEPVVEPVELSTDLAINEVESNGDATDWFEVVNLSGSPIDISGYGVKDDDNTRPDVVPAGTVIEPGGLYVVDQQSASHPAGFDFGLGDSDAVRLYDLDGELVAKYSWSAHAPVTYARCPDGTGPWIATAVSTKGEPNDCSVPVRINEVESSGDEAVLGGADWVELINIGSEPVDVSGLVLKDDNDGRTDAIPSGTTIAAGGLLLLVEDEHFTFGLGGSDSVRLFATDGATLIDTYAWSNHAATSYGRCPNGTGDFETTASVTPGQLNDCAGLVSASPWPGGADVTVLDDADWFSGDMSGIDYEPSLTGGAGTLWAVENGNGLLYKFTADAAGTWSLAAGWENGRVLRFPDGTGTVDAEGVTVVEGEPGVVYVSSERDNDSGSISRPSVLRYDVTGTGELVATMEWNLADDFPGLGANAGLEGITWIPAAALSAGGFSHEAVSAGAFVVGVEGTGQASVYSLGADGSAVQLATIDTTAVAFPMVADVQWDPERNLLWVVCDDACDGRLATYALVDGEFHATGLYERPAGMGNYNTEGFAVGDASLCVDGTVPTFYVDDSDTDGFSLRSGTLPSDCDTTTPGGGDEQGDSGDGDGSAEGDNTAPQPTPRPTPGDVCEVSAPASAGVGDSVTLTVDSECAPAEVRVFLFSEPTDLGIAAVASDGTFTVTIPAGAPAGDHTLEVRSLTGEVVGSTVITITAASVAELPRTGAEGFTGLAFAAAVLASVGGALLVVRRVSA